MQIWQDLKKLCLGFFLLFIKVSKKLHPPLNPLVFAAASYFKLIERGNQSVLRSQISCLIKHQHGAKNFLHKMS